jgi:hypothetical protein
VFDCVLSGASFFASVFTFAPPPIDVIAFGVDVVATGWATLRTEDDFAQGKISSTRRWLLHGTSVVGAVPAILGPAAGFIGTGASFFNLLITATGIPN